MIWMMFAHDFKGREFIFQGSDALQGFCKFLFTPEYAEYTTIGHNLKGRDGQFILGYLHRQENLMSYQMGQRNADRIIFNFLARALATLSKDVWDRRVEEGILSPSFPYQVDFSPPPSFP